MELKFYNGVLDIKNTGTYSIQITDLKTGTTSPVGSQTGNVSISGYTADAINITIDSVDYLLFDSYKLDECIAKTEQAVFSSSSIYDIIAGCKIESSDYQKLTMLICLRFSLLSHAEKNDLIGFLKIYSAMGCNICTDESTTNCGCKG